MKKLALLSFVLLACCSLAEAQRLNFSATTPAPPSGAVNVTPQQAFDGPGNESFYLTSAQVLALMQGLTGCSTATWLISPEDGVCHAPGGTGNVNTGSANTYGAFLQDFSAASIKLPAGFLSGDCSWTALGAITCTKFNGVAFGALATENTLLHSQLPTLLSADIPNNAANTSGNAATATALAATPTLCSGGQVPTGVLPSGNATGCFTPGGTGNVNTGSANTYGAFLQDFSAASIKLPAGFLSGDCSWTALGAITCTKFNGVAFGALATENTLLHSQLPTLLSADIPNNAANTSGNAATATALAATPTLCSGGQVPTGVLPSGNATGCFTPGGTGNVNTGSANTYGAFLQDFSAASIKLPAGFLSGDCSWTALGAITCTKTGGTVFGALATENSLLHSQLPTLLSADIPNNSANAGGLAGSPTTGQYWGYNGTAQGWYTPSGSGTVNSGTTGQLAYYAANGTAVSGEAVPTWNQSTTGNAATATALAATPTVCSGGQAAQGILASGNATGCFTPSGSGTVNSGTAGQLAYYAANGTAVSGNTPGTGVLTALGNATNASGGVRVAQSCQAITATTTATVALASGNCAKVTANGSNFTLSITGAVSGIPMLLDICNDGSARTVTMPSNINGNWSTPVFATECTGYKLYEYDATNWNPQGSTATPTILYGAERSDPGAGSSGSWYAWPDATTHLLGNRQNGATNPSWTTPQGTSGDVVDYASNGTPQDSNTPLSSLAPKASPSFTGTVSLPSGGGGIEVVAAPGASLGTNPPNQFVNEPFAPISVASDTQAAAASGTVYFANCSTTAPCLIPAYSLQKNADGTPKIMKITFMGNFNNGTTSPSGSWTSFFCTTDPSPSTGCSGTQVTMQGTPSAESFGQTNITTAQPLTVTCMAPNVASSSATIYCTLEGLRNGNLYSGVSGVVTLNTTVNQYIGQSVTWSNAGAGSPSLTIMGVFSQFIN